MDLAISPASPLILASASADHTVRLWSLDNAHDPSVDGRQPCAAICAGEGHRESVLSIVRIACFVRLEIDGLLEPKAFHPLGRYLLSGGMDHAINLVGLAPQSAFFKE
jgi:polycomb protein EED